MNEPGSDARQDLRRAVARYDELEGAKLTPLRVGLIHETFAASSARGEFILQRVNPIFEPGIHENIRAVTEHLHRKGGVTLRLVPTREGSLFAELGAWGRWRLLTRVPGVTFATCGSPAQARAAGTLVARFHGALADLEHAFRPLGTPLHDTPRHLENLRRALSNQPRHRLRARVEELADEIFRGVERFEDLRALPRRVIHGDLKFNNVLFAGEGPGAREQARSLIDLDTVSRMPLWVELGDAWRSWCNARGENEAEARLDLALFEASARGYLDALPFPLEPDERRALAHGLERIALELAARFAADTLEERYFHWDADRYPSAAEHNWARARGQLSLYRQALATRAERARMLGA